MLLLAVTIGVLTGTALGLLIAPPLPSFGAVSLAAILSGGGLIVGWRNPPVRWSGIALLAALMSGARVQVDRAQIEASALPPGIQAVRGIVADVPRPIGRAAAFVLNVDSTMINGQWDSRIGRVEAKTFGWVPAEGDRVEIVGEPRLLMDQPGAPRATLLRRQRVTQDVQVERMQLLSAAPSSSGALNPVAVRTWMEERIYEYLDAPQAALTAGLLLGSRSDLSPELRAQFSRTGTSHLVAVSGFNVVIVAGFVTAALLHLIGVRTSAFAAMIAVLGYALIVGAPASAVRAAIMAGAALTARIVGRPTDSMSGLLVAGAVMAFVDPLVVQDLGFQLSMLATAGLILLIPTVTIERGRRRTLVGVVMTPLAAQVATLPLILHTFHSLSLVSLLANVMVVPLVPIAMAAGAALILTSGLEYVATPIAWVTWLASTGILEVVRFCSGLPGAWLATGAFSVSAMLCCYVALLLWVISRSPELRGAERMRPWLRAAVPSMLLVAVLTLVAPTRSPNQIEGELLNVGNAMIATSPSGKVLVVGTDVTPTVLTSAIAERLPFWKRTIEVVVLSDNSPAAWRGVQAIAAQYPVEILVAVGTSSDTDVPPGVGRVVEAVDGTQLDLGDETILTVLPHHVDGRERIRTLPIAMAYGLTGVEFPANESPAMSSTSDGWLTVIRDSSNTSATGAATTRIRWDRSADRFTSGIGLDLIPRNDGPIAFSSDGQRLIVTWSGCDGSDSACSVVIGGESREP